MLHSGSRGAGNVMADWFIKAAKNVAKEKGVRLPDPALAYLEEGTALFDDYMDTVHWVQRYAKVNRAIMREDVMAAIQSVLPGAAWSDDEPVVDCHHNYVAREMHFGRDVWVTRKGAVRAGKGEFGIIPGSMGAQSYLVEGLGEPDSFMSSAHGAGRLMSRTSAKQTYTVEDLKRQTEGVVCRQDVGVLDEIPSAYKSIDEVMAQQTDLVKPVAVFKQFLCVNLNSRLADPYQLPEYSRGHFQTKQCEHIALLF